MNAFDTVMGFTDNEYPVTEGIGNPLKKIIAFFKKTFQRFIAFVKTLLGESKHSLREIRRLILIQRIKHLVQ